MIPGSTGREIIIEKSKFNQGKFPLVNKKNIQTIPMEQDSIIDDTLINIETIKATISLNEPESISVGNYPSIIETEPLGEMIVEVLTVFDISEIIDDKCESIGVSFENLDDICNFENKIPDEVGGTYIHKLEDIDNKNTYGSPSNKETGKRNYRRK